VASQPSGHVPTPLYTALSHNASLSPTICQITFVATVEREVETSGAARDIAGLLEMSEPIRQMGCIVHRALC